MSAGPAIRTVSAQVCRQCRKEQLQKTSRWTNRRRFSLSPAPLASTSTATPATNFTNRLRFEVGQANPSLASTWRSLNAVHDEEPAKLSPDLVRQAIPILQKYRKPGRHFPKVSSGPQYRAELTEEAEALYMRYRFVTSRLRETGSEPQSVAQILYWLQGLKSLSYAPAAWRIWKDALEEAHRNDSLVAKQISTLVLVATAKWLFLLVENTPAPAAIAEARKEADAILAYLEANGQIDGTIASLKVRIIKHSSKFQEFAKVVKATFGLDLEMPCAPAGLASEGNIRPLDKHSHNSILSALAKRQQFSKMVSVFESLAYPHEAATTYPTQTADQNSFFSLSFDWFSPRPRSKDEPPAVEDSTIEQSASDVATDEKDDLPSGSGIGDESIQPEEIEIRPTIELSTLNTRTFELMIENALEASSHGVARHYMLEMLQAWEQERQRLRAAYADLAAYTVPRPSPTVQARYRRPFEANVILRDPTRPAWDRIWQTDTPGPAIGPSVHAIYRIYEELAGEWTTKLDWLKPLDDLVDDVKRVLDLVRDDIQFWTDIHDKQTALAQAFKTLPAQQRSLHAAVEEHSDQVHAASSQSDSFTGYNNLPFNTQLHLLILRKIEAEVNDIHHKMHHRHRHVAAGRYVRSMLQELEGQRKTLRIGRLVNAIRRSEAWCSADEAADEQRAEAIMALNTLSHSQKGNHVRTMLRLAEGRRQSIKRAVQRAQGILLELTKVPEDAAEAARAPGPGLPIVKAVHNRGLASQLRGARKAYLSDQRLDGPSSPLASVTAQTKQTQNFSGIPSVRKLRHTRVQLRENEKDMQSSAAMNSSGSTSTLPDSPQ